MEFRNLSFAANTVPYLPSPRVPIKAHFLRKQVMSTNGGAPGHNKASSSSGDWATAAVDAEDWMAGGGATVAIGAEGWLAWDWVTVDRPSVDFVVTRRRLASGGLEGSG